MAASSVEICNSALIKVGADVIDSLDDDNKRARLCKERYDKKRKDLISKHPWNFAMKRATLAADVSTPDHEFDNQFTLPADCLRVLALYEVPIDQPWVIEGRKLLIDDSSIQMLYLSDATDTGLFPPYFDEALAYEIAVDICYGITQSASRTRDLNAEKEISLRNARSMDAQEGKVRQVEASEWRDARFQRANAGISGPKTY